jgi:hypothetical protein
MEGMYRQQRISATSRTLGFSMPDRTGARLLMVIADTSQPPFSRLLVVLFHSWPVQHTGAKLGARSRMRLTKQM